MEITKGSDLILILNLEDFKSEKMRVADCADFRLYVWTANRNNFLQFSKRDISQDEKIDKIAIPDFMMNCLESGVICYQYRYSKLDGHFNITDSHYDKSKVCVSDLYWRNCNLNEEPSNPVNYLTLNYLKDLIENVSLKHEKDVYDIKEILKNTDLWDKLNEEIKRSNEVDVELFNAIKNNQKICDENFNQTNEKIDSEIKRSNEVDVEIFNLIKNNKNESKEEIERTNDKLDDEIARSKQADIDHENAINNEITRAQNAETVITTKIENEIERAKTAEGAIRDAVENERDRAITKETLINDTLTSEIDRAKNEEKRIEDLIKSNSEKDLNLSNRLDEEITRATDSETQLTNNLSVEIARAKAEENRIEAKLNDDISNLSSEITRAKTVESDITSSLQSLKTVVENEKQRSADRDTQHTNSINEVSTQLDIETQRAKDREEHINNDLHNEISRAQESEEKLKQLIEDNAEEIKAFEDSVNDNIEKHNQSVENELNQAVKYQYLTDTRKTVLLNNHDSISGYGSDGQEAYNIAMVSKWNVADFGSVSIPVNLNGSEERPMYNDTKEIALTEDVENALNDANNYTDKEISKINANEAELGNRIAEEVKRSTEAEKSIIDALNDEIKRSTDSDTAHEATFVKMEAKIDTNTEKISSESERAKTVEKDITEALQQLKSSVQNKNTEVSETINNIKSSVKANADAINVINGDDETIGSIQHSLQDSKHYTDDQLQKYNQVIENVLSDYTTKKDVDNRIKDVIGTAPEALDTLGEISDALSKDSDAISAINSVLVGKANSEDVYTKAQVEALHTAINNSISTLETAIDTETQRAKAAEKLNADAINVINGDIETIGSLAHTLSDSKHYTDDKIAELQAEENVKLLKLATKDELAELDTKLSAHTATAAETYQPKGDYLTEHQSLANYYTKEEANAIFSGGGTGTGVGVNIVNEMGDSETSVMSQKAVSDEITDINNTLTNYNSQLSLKANKADVYSKTEVDNKVKSKTFELSSADFDSVWDANAELENAKNTGCFSDILYNIKPERMTIARFNELDGLRVGDFVNVSDYSFNSVITKRYKESKNDVLECKVFSQEHGYYCYLMFFYNRNTNWCVFWFKPIVDTIKIITPYNNNSIVEKLNELKETIKNGEDFAVSEIEFDEVSKNIIKYINPSDIISIYDYLRLECTYRDYVRNVGSVAEFTVKHLVSDTRPYINYLIRFVLDKNDNFVSITGTSLEQSSTIDLSDYYTKEEVNEAINAVDITEQLNDYAKANEITVIRDNDNNIITTLEIDNSDEDDSVEIYTKAQCDERFLRVWSGTQEEYDALETKDNKVLYVILYND